MKRETKIPAHLTGVETEGELAGELVCPKINVWAIDKNGNRTKRIRVFNHGQAVFILGERQGVFGEKLYYIRHQKYFNARGWVTERFVIKDGEDSDVGAAGVS